MLEEQHPIPQQISSYQFRLVGDMTIKQFFQVAGGALVSIFFYSSTLPSYIKWPLVIFSFLMGIALAFFPLQDRPLATWIFLFFKAIYSPTIYLWKKDAHVSDFFAPEEDVSINTPPGAPVGVSIPPITPTQTGDQKAVSNFSASLQSVPPIVPTQVKIIPKDNQMGQSIPDVNNQPNQKERVAVPQKTEIQVEKSKKEDVLPITSQIDSIQTQFTPSQATPLAGVAAVFMPEASPPQIPNTPNIIVGQVLDSLGKIIDGAILDILDSQGRPARALRSNRLGHFMIVTPLTNGSYTIKTEKEGFQFDPISINAEGQIIPPIAIIAKT